MNAACEEKLIVANKLGQMSSGQIWFAINNQRYRETQLRKGSVIRVKAGEGKKDKKGREDNLALFSYRNQSFVGDIPGIASADGLIDLVAHLYHTAINGRRL